MRSLGNFFRARTVENFFLDVRVHEGPTFFTPNTYGVFDGLIGDLLVTLANDDVDRCLAADELRQGRDHNRISEFGPNLSSFLQSMIELVFHTDEPQLMA